MGEYIGLDVSLKETAISVRRDGKRVWRGKCPSDPSLIAEVIRKQAPAAERVVFETGPLSVWFYHALRAEGHPAICIDARHAKAALDMAPNKTDANDADGLAHLAEVGFYREVRVKGYDSMLIRTLVAAIHAKEYRKLQEELDDIEAKLMTWHRADECSRRLAQIPGVGPIGASLLMMKRLGPRCSNPDDTSRPGSA